MELEELPIRNYHQSWLFNWESYYIYIKERNSSPKIIVGKILEYQGYVRAALIAGICSMGGEAICVGVHPLLV